MPTKKSEAVKAAEENGAVRMKTIRRGIKPLVQSQAIADTLRDFAERSGITRHVVSLVANELLLRGGAHEIDNWFLWYTRVWSAVEYHVKSSGLHKDNPFVGPVKRVFRKYPLLLKHLKQAVPERVPVMARQQECNTMAVATCEHIKAFPDRVLATLTVKVTNILWNLDGDLRCVQKAAAAARGHVLDAPKDASEAALRAKLLGAGVTARQATAIVLMSRAERLLLGDLTASPDYRNRWSYVVKSSKHCWQLVVHLKRYSAYMSEFMKNEFMLPPEEGGGDGGGEAEEEEEEEASATEEPLPSEQRKWTRYRKPRPFTVLPVFKLQASMMYYGYTEVEALFAYIHPHETAAYDKEHPKRRYPKRKRGVGDEELKAAVKEYEEYEQNRVKQRPTLHIPDKLHFARGVLREKRMDEEGIGKAGFLSNSNENKGWILSNFRTNGVVVTLTFVTNDEAVSGVAELVDKGYSSVPVCEGVDVATCGRGLWHIRQTEGSVTCSSAINVVSVDPGLRKPVQWSTVGSDANLASSPEVATFGDIDESTWLRHSGRADRTAWEERRRKRNRDYAAALDKFSGVLRRTADTAVFSEYIKVCAETLPDRVAELCHRRRSLRSWLSQRRLQSYLSRVADRLANTEPKRMKLSSGSLHGTLLSTEERQQLRDRIRARRKEKGTPRPTAVFFGDGEFSHAMRGHVSIPKKSILHHLGTRVPTILIDEYNTSSKCVCGQPLRNATNDSACRVRVHQDGGDCHALRCGICDRDELATLNIAQASLSALAQRPWPSHLLRRNT
jgi:hypothetical protein